MWRFESIHGFGSVGNLYHKMHFAGSNPATGQKTPKCIYKISKNFRVEKTGEISRNLRFFVFSCLHLNQTRIMCLQANSDADFVLANSGAARWYTSPLVKQGLASDRDLPGLQNHACKQNYVIISPLNSSISPINTFCPVSRGNRLYCRKTSKRRYSQ